MDGCANFTHNVKSSLILQIPYHHRAVLVVGHIELKGGNSPPTKPYIIIVMLLSVYQNSSMYVSSNNGFTIVAAVIRSWPHLCIFANFPCTAHATTYEG